MTDRERLLEILNVPIYPHENVDPLEAVADYLIDNGVRVPVICEHCRFSIDEDAEGWLWCNHWNSGTEFDSYCNAGERKDKEDT